MTITVFACLEEGRMAFSGLHQDIMINKARTDTVELVETEGMWIGVMDDLASVLDDKSLSLEKDDVMLVYTDGITEAYLDNSSQGLDNPGRIMFSEDRLRNILLEHGKDDPDIIKKTIISTLEGYRCDDDVTFIIIKKT